MSRPDSLILSIVVPTRSNTAMPAKLDPKLAAARAAHKAANKALTAAQKAKTKADAAHEKAVAKFNKATEKLSKYE